MLCGLQDGHQCLTETSCIQFEGKLDYMCYKSEGYYLISTFCCYKMSHNYNYPRKRITQIQIFSVRNLLNNTENLPVCLFGHQVGPLLHLGLQWLWSWLAKISCQYRHRNNIKAIGSEVWCALNFIKDSCYTLTTLSEITETCVVSPDTC